MEHCFRTTERTESTLGSQDAPGNRSILRTRFCSPKIWPSESMFTEVLYAARPLVREGAGVEGLSSAPSIPTPTVAPHRSQTYPLGHLMLGTSLRNQGRNLWNCSADGLTGPTVNPMQVFKQFKEAAGNVRAGRTWPPVTRPPESCPHYQLLQNPSPQAAEDQEAPRNPPHCNGEVVVLISPSAPNCMGPVRTQH